MIKAIKLIKFYEYDLKCCDLIKVCSKILRYSQILFYFFSYKVLIIKSILREILLIKLNLSKIIEQSSEFSR